MNLIINIRFQIQMENELNIINNFHIHIDNTKKNIF